MTALNALSFQAYYVSLFYADGTYKSSFYTNKFI